LRMVDTIPPPHRKGALSRAERVAYDGARMVLE
jgi:hypothetical protein